MKRCLTLLIMREMQSKTTMRYHFTPVRMAIIKKFTNSKCSRRCGEKGTLLRCWWKCKLIQPLWRKLWRFLKTLGIKLPNAPIISLLVVYPEETVIETAAVFTIDSTWKQSRCSSIDEWIKKLWNITQP